MLLALANAMLARLCLTLGHQMYAQSWLGSIHRWDCNKGTSSAWEHLLISFQGQRVDPYIHQDSYKV